MKIAFDGKRYFKNHTGLGNYSRTLIRNLVKYYPENEYHVFANNTRSSNFQLPVKTKLQDPEKKFGTYWRSYGITNDVNGLSPKIYHGLSNELPATSGKIKAKKIVTIHDLFFHHFAKDFSFFDRNIYRKKTLQACKDADHIVAISHSTKNDIVEILGVNPKKISVVYQSCNDIFQNPQEINVLKKFEGLPSSFALFVGSLNHRKNILGLVSALATLPPENRIPLVIVGNGHKKFVNFLKDQAASKGVLSSLVFVGALSNEDLLGLYRKARFTCLVSFYEGFGIPVLESLFSNTPVLVSNISALPEAAGNCGLKCNPHDISSIAESLKLMTMDDSKMADFQSQIAGHLIDFSSHNTADSMVKLYQSDFF